MSYIRCLSNPERLYIWGDVDGHVHVTWIDSQDAHQHARVKQSHWDGLFRKLLKDEFRDPRWSEQPISHGDLTVQEVTFSWHRHKPVGPRVSQRMLKASMQASCDLYDKKITKEECERIDRENDTDFLIEMNVAGKKCYMWAVTWEYIKDSAIAHLREGKKRKRPTPIQTVARRIAKKYFKDETAERKRFEDITLRAGNPYEYGMRTQEQVLADAAAAILEKVDVITTKQKRGKKVHT